MEGELILRLSPKDLKALAEMVTEMMAERVLLALRQPPPPAPQEDDMISAKEIQELFGIKPSTFYDWRKKGNFPKGLRCGPKLIRWPRSEVLDYARKEGKS